jgi:hypothetical protein
MIRDKLAMATGLGVMPLVCCVVIVAMLWCACGYEACHACGMSCVAKMQNLLDNYYAGGVLGCDDPAAMVIHICTRQHMHEVNHGHVQACVAKAAIQ